MLILAINQSSKAHLLTAELLAAIEEVVLTKSLHLYSVKCGSTAKTC